MGLYSSAILGKIIGVVLPAKIAASKDHSLLLGISMIPRAEIALVIMMSGLSMTGQEIPQEAYISVIIVSLCTCLVGPLWSHNILQRQQRSEQVNG